MGAAERIAYLGAQGARTLWYGAHYAATAHLTASAVRPGHAPRPIRGGRRAPRALRRALMALLARDLANVEAGLYPPPELANPLAMMARSRDYFTDLRAVDRRRLARDARLADAADEGLPSYYRRAFHYQSDGYLSDASARRYEFQVETLFTGAAAAMRRQALPALREGLADGPRDARLIDVGCGAGGFLREVKRAMPALRATGLDLSAPYLARAGRALRGARRVTLIQGSAEAIPLGDGSQDAATAIFLFHELPARARAAVMAEIGRIVRPGGRFILVDALQTGDDPGLDGVLETFPINFHEPYFASWLKADLNRLGRRAGLTLRHVENAYLAKVAVFERVHDA